MILINLEDAQFEIWSKRVKNNAPLKNILQLLEKRIFRTKEDEMILFNLVDAQFEISK